MNSIILWYHLLTRGASGYNSALGNLCACVCVWTGRILLPHPKLSKISIHDLHMVCSNRLSEKILQRRLHSAKKACNTLHVRIATVKPYPQFNREALIRSKPYLCNCAVHVAIACTVTRLLELKTRVRLRTGSDVDLYCMMRLSKDQSGIYGAVLQLQSR